MKDKEVYLPNGFWLILVFFIGAILNWFNVFAPLHEIWHLIFGWMDGAAPGGWTYVTHRGPLNNVALYAGYFGEIISFFAAMTLFLLKLRFSWAILFLGAAHATPVYGWNGSDFAEFHPGALFAWWCVFWLVVMWIMYMTIFIRVAWLTRGN